MKFLLIDGHYYVYRSFFAIRNLSNSHGEPTNAIYGFIKTIRKMLKDLVPDRAAVIWDEGLPERRTLLQPDYKATRVAMPSEMIPQLDFIRAIVPLLGLPSLGSPGNEADDLMGSYTVSAGPEYEVILATNDKDLFQLTNDRVKIYSTNKTDLASPGDPHALLGPEAVRRKWGVEPRLIADVLALIGDSVDNIPGVAGFGPKTAAALLLQYGDLDLLLAHPSRITHPKLREKISSSLEQIRQNREMVRLDLDLPLPCPVDDLRIVPRHAELLAALERCEFRGLVTEIQAEAAAFCPEQKRVPATPERPAQPAGQSEFSF